jgi:hypothetical protein
MYEEALSVRVRHTSFAPNGARVMTLASPSENWPHVEQSKLQVIEDSERPSVEHVCSTPFCKVVLLVVLMTTQEVVVLKRVTLTEVEIGAVLLLVAQPAPV